MISNFHTHSTFCDGADSAEAMVRAAILKGCAALGFSGHALQPEQDWTMTSDSTAAYVTEINRLKSKYSGVIELYLGVEQDYYSYPPEHEYDYIIGAVHCLKKGENYLSVDSRASDFRQNAIDFFSGDFYAFAEEYYEKMSELPRRTHCDIVAHFDLITKFNDRGYFDETHPRYVAAAVSAIDEILKYTNLFELNTGAIYRVNKREAYPAGFLLRELYSRNAEIILASDSHDTDSLCYGFESACALLKSIGFRAIKTIESGKFVSVML